MRHDLTLPPTVAPAPPTPRPSTSHCWRWEALLLLIGVLGWSGCKEKPQTPLRSLAPAPLPSMESAEHSAGAPTAARDPVFGEPVPAKAMMLSLEGSVILRGDVPVDLRNERDLQSLKAAIASAPAVVLAPDGETYLAQASPLLSVLDDLHVEPWLLHPSRLVAYKLVLRDERAFQRWLDEPRPGKIRIIQRADGLELQTNIGKLPGGDPNGPTLPIRSGQLDVLNLRRGLARLLQRFPDAKDCCVVPSFGTQLSKVAGVWSGTYSGKGEGMFSELCLVYPRPPK